MSHRLVMIVGMKSAPDRDDRNPSSDGGRGWITVPGPASDRRAPWWSGKWLLFWRPDRVDESWALVRDATIDGGGAAAGP